MCLGRQILMLWHLWVFVLCLYIFDNGEFYATWLPTRLPSHHSSLLQFLLIGPAVLKCLVHTHADRNMQAQCPYLRLFCLVGQNVLGHRKWTWQILASLSHTCTPAKHNNTTVVLLPKVSALYHGWENSLIFILWPCGWFSVWYERTRQTEV